MSGTEYIVEEPVMYSSLFIYHNLFDKRKANMITSHAILPFKLCSLLEPLVINSRKFSKVFNRLNLSMFFKYQIPKLSCRKPLEMCL